MKISGVSTALITPFLKGKIDYNSIESLLSFQLRSGVKNFVIHGTTGEGPTLSAPEKQEMFSFIRKNTPKETTLIAGTGTNNTESTINETIQAAKNGAEAALVVVPYYNKPPQRGLLSHFNLVAEKSPIPIILYNVPSRTVTGLELNTIQLLSENPKIIGIKEASGNLEFAQQIRKACHKQFILLSGDDETYEEFMSRGGDGCISVVSHIIPRPLIQLNTNKYTTLIRLLFCESNPIPVKMALNIMGIIKSPELRLPLIQLSEENTKRLKKELTELEILL